MNAKTQDRIDRVLAAMFTFAHIGEVSEDDIKAAIELALKEQDRDTRHACAEAMNLNLIQSNYHMPASEVLTRAHQACMNTQAV